MMLLRRMYWQARTRVLSEVLDVRRVDAHWRTGNRPVRKFLANGDNTAIVSWPRCGSHWLRMLMEQYFGRPLMPKVFYYPDSCDYLACHTHDTRLRFCHPTVIYLHRDPVSAVFSYVVHDGGWPVQPLGKVILFAEQYGRHRRKWLRDETFTRRKTILTYEEMQTDLPRAFAKVVAHFGQSLDAVRLLEVTAKVTKEEVRDRVGQYCTVQLTPEYAERAELFRQAHGNMIYEIVGEEEAK